MEKSKVSTNALKKKLEKLTKKELVDRILVGHRTRDEQQAMIEECRAQIVDIEQATEKLRATCQSYQKVVDEQKNEILGLKQSLDRVHQIMADKDTQLRLAESKAGEMRNSRDRMDSQVKVLEQEKQRLIDAISLLASSASVDSHEVQLNAARQQGYEHGKAQLGQTTRPIFGRSSFDPDPIADPDPFPDLGSHGYGG